MTGWILVVLIVVAFAYRSGPDLVAGCEQVVERLAA